jgi:hypothetical protein
MHEHDLILLEEKENWLIHLGFPAASLETPFGWAVVEPIHGHGLQVASVEWHLFVLWSTLDGNLRSMGIPSVYASDCLVSDKTYTDRLHLGPGVVHDLL